MKLIIYATGFAIPFLVLYMITVTLINFMDLNPLGLFTFLMMLINVKIAQKILTVIMGNSKKEDEQLMREI